MTGDLVVDSRALDHAALALRRASTQLAGLRLEDALADASGALPATDTGAACSEVGRRLGAGVLALAESVGSTADAVSDAVAAYAATEGRLAASATGLPVAS